MKSAIISIVSEQTIPNVLFIKEKQQLVEFFLFITTPGMESNTKTDAIIRACHLPVSKTSRIIVDETKPAEMSQLIKEWIDFKFSTFHLFVNLTGGTKLMTLAIHSLLKEYNASFWYLPIGLNTISEVRDDFTETLTAIKHQLSLHEYLKANGLQYSVKVGMVYTPESCSIIFNEWRKHHFVLEHFPLQLADKLTGLALEPQNAPGEWFEEYVFFNLRNILHLSKGKIAASVMIFSDEQSPLHDNEYDVMWVHDNTLHVAECKVSLGSKPRAKLDNVMYKLGAINKLFGLKTYSHIFTLANLRKMEGSLSPDLTRRLKILNINELNDKSTILQKFNTL